MGEIEYGAQSGVAQGRSTYSDIPIQVAEKAVSRREFIEDLGRGSGTATEVLNELSKILQNNFCLADDHYTFNSILNRGTVRLQFHIVQQFQAEFNTMGSLTLQSARLMIDRNCRADVYVEGNNRIRLENLKGSFVVLVDGKRRLRGEIRLLIIEFSEESGLVVSIDATNPFSKMSASSMIKLRLIAGERLVRRSRNSIPGERSSAMKRFRNSYSSLESVSRTGAFKVKLTHSISRWFATLKEILGRKGS
ncbi:MAG: hypothetical protein H6677_14300 [Candidatus Obscuribacterales bacterium]|nr:hypothetical protein [Candidatus Obscuribacterales bacterium]